MVKVVLQGCPPWSHCMVKDEKGVTLTEETQRLLNDRKARGLLRNLYSQIEDNGTLNIGD